MFELLLQVSTFNTSSFYIGIISGLSLAVWLVEFRRKMVDTEINSKLGVIYSVLFVVGIVASFLIFNFEYGFDGFGVVFGLAILSLLWVAVNSTIRTEKRTVRRRVVSVLKERNVESGIIDEVRRFFE